MRLHRPSASGAAVYTPSGVKMCIPSVVEIAAVAFAGSVPTLTGTSAEAGMAHRARESDWKRHVAVPSGAVHDAIGVPDSRHMRVGGDTGRRELPIIGRRRFCAEHRSVSGAGSVARIV